MNDFSHPRRMGEKAFLIILAKNIKGLASICFLLAVTELSKLYVNGTYMPTRSGLTVFLGIIIGALAIALLGASAKYLTQKFHIKDGNLIFSHGIIRHETKTIPLSRIHSLRTNRGIIYQILGMRGIKFDTLASKGEEVELILSETDWHTLQNVINVEETRPTECHDEDSIQQEAVGAHESESAVVFSNKYLLLSAFCQNHLKGFIVLAAVWSMLYDMFHDIDEEIYDQIVYSTESYLEQFTFTPLIVVLILLGLYVCVAILWLGKTFLLYYDMVLRYSRKLLTFSYGLFNRATCRFPFDKVCTIWVKRNFLEKKFGLCTIMLRQAMNATAEKRDENLKIYGKDMSEFFLGWWLGDNYASSPEIISAKSGKGVILHTMLMDIVIALAAAIALCYYSLPELLILPAIYLMISLAKGICAMRRSRITLKESYLEIRNGRFADIRNYLKYEDIQVVRISRSPFTRIFHRVSLSLSTSGSTFTIRSLKENEATQIYEIFIAYVIKCEESKTI